MNPVVERTHDMGALLAIWRHPAVFPWITDDACPPVEEFAPEDDPTWIHLLARDEDGAGPFGAFTLHPINAVAWFGHQAVLPERRGRWAVRAFKAGIAWMFENTPCRKIVGLTPVNNKAAYRVAKWAGCRDEGILRASVLKDGVLLDQYIVGIEKGN